jgi:hypothetical protein
VSIDRRAAGVRGFRYAGRSVSIGPDQLAERIPDEGLRELAEKGSDDPVSVIIELAVPDQHIEYERKPGDPRSMPKRVVVADDGGTVEKTAEEARAFLEQLLSDPPVYLRSARAFVATVRGPELREIAKRPFTKRVEPNQRLTRS